MNYLYTMFWGVVSVELDRYGKYDVSQPELPSFSLVGHSHYASSPRTTHRQLIDPEPIRLPDVQHL